MTAPPPERLFRAPLATPLGDAALVFDGEGRLRAFDWESHESRMLRLLARQQRAAGLEPAPAPAALIEPFERYFSGELTALAAVPWTLGGTAFQQAVWRALTDIPPGRTESYGALAARIGAPKAVRAVGLANGANPLGLVVPCHRVIGANGSLTGYGGGLERKLWLLRHEGVESAGTRVDLGQPLLFGA